MTAAAWSAVDPSTLAGGDLKRVLAPLVFGQRHTLWSELLVDGIDQMSSDVRTLDLLSLLVAFTEPRTIVEVGTYRGIGTAVLAETLNLFEIPGHVLTCDPTDFHVPEMLKAAALDSLVTYVHGTFEDLLPRLKQTMDFCYIDASNKEESSLRLRYTELALDYMSPNGIVVVDDAAGGWRGAKELRKKCDLFLPHRRGLAIFTV